MATDYGFGLKYSNSLDNPTYRSGSIGTERLGISTPPMQNQVDSLKARIFQGAKRVELGFWGKAGEKGSASQGTWSPEMYGKEEREALRGLAKINRIELSTHASPFIGSVSGYTGKAFAEPLRDTAVTEIKKTIDFAADTARGGPIVVHMGEYSSPVQKKEHFETFEGAGKYEEISAVDKETGVIHGTEMYRDRDVFLTPINEFEPKLIKYDDFRRNVKNYVSDDQCKQWTGKSLSSLPDEYYPVLFNKKRIYDEASSYKGKETEWRNNANLLLDKAKNAVNVNERKSYEAQAKDYLQTAAQMRGQREIQMKTELVPVGEYALKNTAKSLADAAMYAYTVERDRKLEKPIFIAPENIFPGQYGGHPDELKEIVVRSREKFGEMLQKKGMSHSEAKKVAESKIKATFDIGHANTWKQYFKGSPEDFDKWLLGKTKDLIKSGIIGHVHMADNFGYVDEHLTPGQGNAPIKEFVDQLKEEKFSGTMIVEPAHQDYRALHGAYKALGSPIYRVEGATQTWTDIQGSYFGRTYSPPYTVGDYSPDPKVWTLWSQLPLE